MTGSAMKWRWTLHLEPEAKWEGVWGRVGSRSNGMEGRRIFFRSLGAPFFVFVFSEFSLQVLELSFCILESILDSFGGHLEVILVTF